MTRSRTVLKASAATDFSSDEFAHLTSKQTWECLTTLLYRAVLPLVKTTTFAIDLLFVILTSTSDQRRKISIFESAQCLDIAYSLLFKSPETIIRTIIFDMGVERWVIANFINNYLNGSYTPRPIQTDGSYYYSFEAVYRHVRDSYELYNVFRRRVCERFIKLANSQASKNRWTKEQFGLMSEQGDNENNYFLSVVRAIDKLYPGKGALAKYVMLWLGNSTGSTFSQYMGEAFNLSRPVRKAIHDGQLIVNNKAYDLENAIEIPAPEQININNDDMSSLTEVIGQVQSIPELSMTLLLHGFKQVPTPKLLEQMQRHLQHVEGLDNYEHYLNIPMPDIEDLPVILPLSRASRKNTENQRRRKDVLHLRKTSNA